MRNIKRFLIGSLAALISVSAIVGLSGCSVDKPVNETTTLSEYNYYNELTTAPDETNTVSVSEQRDTTNTQCPTIPPVIETTKINEGINIPTKPATVKQTTTQKQPTASGVSVDLSKIPAFANKPYVVINNNMPGFSAQDKNSTRSFERYAALDSKGRCGVAYACIGKDLMPTGERGEIGQIKPTGWHTVKYDGVDGKYLYNRCHLIGWQLTSENANERNLITGTRYMNVDGMLPFENMVDDYIEETGNHVLYRVTPIFKDNNLLASGIQIEAYSVEDEGEGICFNVYCYNAQPGVTIDYADGSSTGPAIKVTTTPNTTTKTSVSRQGSADYILNINTKKFHYPTCSSVGDMAAKNKENFKGDRQTLMDRGYSPCGRCHP